MTNEKKQEFTRRITQANRSELVLIKFEILFTYLDDARKGHTEGDYNGFKQAVHYADDVLRSFEQTLNFEYELSGSLYSIYDFHRRQLSKAILHNSTEELVQSREMLEQIYTAFQTVAKTDHSKPLMQNVQQVYAGYTYGKDDLNESYDTDSSRGFLV